MVVSEEDGMGSSLWFLVGFPVLSTVAGSVEICVPELVMGGGEEEALHMQKMKEVRLVSVLICLLCM